MTKLKIILIVFVFALLMTGCGSTVQKVQTKPESSAFEQQKTEYTKKIYIVYGMDCPGCHSGLEKLVEQLVDVVKAKANWEKKQLTVYIKPGHKLNDKDVFNAIKKANFTPGKKPQKKK